MMAPLPEPLRVVVVDDDRPARQRVVDLLRHDPDIGAIAECETGTEAIAEIRRHRPDLLFLYVQMPERDGIEVVDALGPEAMPFTVFVTAYDQHAIKAFEANALDYLLKPFSDGRFEAALSRAKARVADSIVQFETISHGEVEAVLRSGARLRVSRTYRALFEERLGRSLA